MGMPCEQYNAYFMSNTALMASRRWQKRTWLSLAVEKFAANKYVVEWSEQSTKAEYFQLPQLPTDSRV